MHQASQDFDQLQESQFPAFPVVFRPEPEDSSSNNPSPQKSGVTRGPFRLPDKQVDELQAYLNNPINHSYPELFKESWENGQHNIDNFFSIYQPLDPQFVKEMKSQPGNLKIVRISSHKVYVGEFKEGKCSGKCIIIFKNGNIYEGMMSNNKRDGKGYYLQSGVGWFKGTFFNDLKTDQGIEVIFKKWAFSGLFLNGLRHEKGLYVEKGGIVYHGQWKLGIMHGKGVLKTGQYTYHGMLVNSLKHGQGEERFTNGDIYKGEYQNNRFDGFGTYNWKQGDATYEGSFKNGLRHGKGKWSSGQTKYSGAYAQGLKEGYGELYFPSGNFYKGNFICDKREGYGQMFWTDGSFYKGDWKNGVQNGKGQIYLTGGEVISGLFENSILVQVIPSLYEKQMEISSMGIQDLFGSNPKLPTTTKTKTHSESKHLSTHGKKKLSKIDEHDRKRNTIKDNMYFQSPEKSGGARFQQTAHPRQHINHHNPHHMNVESPNRNSVQGITPTKHLRSNNKSHHHHNASHSYEKAADGRQCTRCQRRLENFRLRQRLKTKMNDSKVENTLHQKH